MLQRLFKLSLRDLFFASKDPIYLPQKLKEIELADKYQYMHNRRYIIEQMIAEKQKLLDNIKYNRQMYDEEQKLYNSHMETYKIITKQLDEYENKTRHVPPHSSVKNIGIKLGVNYDATLIARRRINGYLMTCSSDKDELLNEIKKINEQKLQECKSTFFGYITYYSQNNLAERKLDDIYDTIPYSRDRF